MAELTNLITVERGANAIFKNNTWSWGWSAVVGYESGQFRIERYRFVVPEKDKEGKPVVKVDSIDFNFGKSENFPVGGGSGTPSYIISNDAELKGFNPGSGGKVTTSKIYNEGSLQFYDGKDLTIKINVEELKNDPLPPGTYYLFIYYNSTIYFWRHWNGHIAPSCNCSYSSYTKCLPPKDFTAPARFAPGSPTQIKLAWNNNNLGGIENEVNYYRIEYGFDKEYSSNTTTSGNVPTCDLYIYATDEQRGDTLYIRIKTIGKQSGYNSEWVETTSRVNILPTMSPARLPQAYADDRVYQLTQFDLRATDCDGKELQDFQYVIKTEAPSPSDNWLDYNEEGIDFSNSTGGQKIWFRADDGVEYSEPSYLEVFVISAPGTTDMTLQCNNTDHFLDATAIFDSDVVSENYPDRVKIALFNENDVLISETSRFSRTVDSDKEMFICSNYDLFVFFQNRVLQDGYKYKIKFSFYINYADDKYLEFSREIDSQVISLFENDPPDTMYSTIQIGLKMEENRTPISIGASGGAVESYKYENGYFNIHTSSSSETEYNTTVIAIYSYGVKIQKTFSATYVLHPRISNQIPDGTDNIEIDGFKIPDPNIIIPISIAPGTLGGYNTAALCIDNTGPKLELNRYGSSTGDTLQYELDYKKVRKWLIENFYTTTTEYCGVKVISIKLCMYSSTNNNLEIQYSLPFEVKLNFAKAPEACEITSLSLNPGKYIQEGGSAKVELTVKPYSYQDIYARLVYLEGEEQRQLGDIVTINPKDKYSYGSFGENAAPQAGRFTDSFTFQNFSQIEAPFENLFLQVSIDKTTWVNASSGYGVQVIAHKPPSITIKSGEIIRENNVKYISLTVAFDSGYSLPTGASEDIVSVTNHLYKQQEYLGKAGKDTFKYNIGNDTATIFTVCIEYTTEIAQHEKSARSNYFTIYDEAPTVSYRPNQVAINTATIDSTEESAFIVTGATGRNLVSFIGTSGKAYIDLNTRGLCNFIFDCGSWDGTPGGIIPSNPDTPAGLARVAYTGQIGDLLQGKYEIVLSGGDSGMAGVEQSSEEI